jgi:hypothetical protein
MPTNTPDNSSRRAQPNAVMKHAFSFGVCALVAALAASSCTGDAAAPQAACPDSTASVNATVVVGDSVVFDWTPKCAVALLVVEETMGHDHWWIAGFDPDSVENPPATANSIAPRVTYGRSPATATNSFGPEPLIPGTTYMVALWRVLSSGSTLHCQQTHGSACLVAVTSFKR